MVFDNAFRPVRLGLFESFSILGLEALRLSLGAAFIYDIMSNGWNNEYNELPYTDEFAPNYSGMSIWLLMGSNPLFIT